jgi:hypothetical protein
MFYLDAAYVTMTIHVCCKCVFQNFQGLDVACFYLDVAYVAVAIHICCQCIFYLFQTCVASVLSRCYVCYSSYTHMLQTYVLIVSPSFSTLQQAVLIPTRSNLRTKHALHQAPLHHRTWSLTVEHVDGSTHVHAQCEPSLSLALRHARCVILSY